jgi:hypothetical protein
LSTQPVHPDGCLTGCCVFRFVCSSPFRTLKADVERLDAMLAAERARTSTAIAALAALAERLDALAEEQRPPIRFTLRCSGRRPPGRVAVVMTMS